MSAKILIHLSSHGQNGEATNKLVARAAKLRGLSKSQFCLKAVELAAAATVRREERKAAKGAGGGD